MTKISMRQNPPPSPPICRPPSPSPCRALQKKRTRQRGIKCSALQILSVLLSHEGEVIGKEAMLHQTYLPLTLELFCYFPSCAFFSSRIKKNALADQIYAGNWYQIVDLVFCQSKIWTKSSDKPIFHLVTSLPAVNPIWGQKWRTGQKWKGRNEKGLHMLHSASDHLVWSNLNFTIL